MLKFNIICNGCPGCFTEIAYVDITRDNFSVWIGHTYASVKCAISIFKNGIYRQRNSHRERSAGAN